MRPGVYGLASTRNPETLRVSYTQDKTKRYPLYLFPQGAEYKMWGFIPLDRHLFGLGPEATTAQAPFFLLGSDRLGRDMLSRIIYGTRVSLLVGVVATAFAVAIGTLIGTAAG